MKCTVNLAILSVDSIKLLATSLAQITQVTNELTRASSVSRKNIVISFNFSSDVVAVSCTKMSSTCCRIA